MSEVSAVPINSTDATRDLQERLGRFGRVGGIISLVMLVASITGSALGGPEASPVPRSSRAFHVFGTALALGVWAYSRRGSLKVRTIHALDAALTITLCACWALLGIGIPEKEPVEFSIILATTYTLITRSVVVPSTFRRTFSISLVAIVPTVVFFALRRMCFVEGAPAAQINTFLIFATLWCLVAVFVSALQSRQLYGLRQRIREASKIGQYTLEEKIGEGGMGVVYRATHAMLRRPAAIKLLLPDRAGDRELARFEREVQQTSRLVHPNTVSIFDYGRTADGTFYYVMELLDGFDLESLVDAEGSLEPSRVIRILGQASAALVEAHGLGLIHRDIKPANLMLTERTDEADIVKVVDFGLVKALGGSDVGVTKTDAITGTPLYLAPEAITTPDAVDGRADLYALGAVGYFLVTGVHVFDAKTVVEMCSKHLLEAPIPPSVRLGRPVPSELEAVILKCLAKSPDARFGTARELTRALARCALDHPHDGAAAERWWKERAPALRSQKSTRPTPEPKRTMAIDLHRRNAQLT